MKNPVGVIDNVDDQLVAKNLNAPDLQPDINAEWVRVGGNPANVSNP